VSSENRNSKYKELFEDLKCCVLIPTFNNAGFLHKLLDEVVSYGSAVIVVNDGSTDDTAHILSAHPSVTSITFPKNQGKGAALRAGFEKALELGYDHAITMDSDSQHRASDLPAFLEALEKESPVLIMGSRVLDQENVPGKNRFANRISSFWFRIETGCRLKDTQSGFRLYPVRELEGIRLVSGRYEYELELLVKSVWKEIPAVEIPINVHYPPGDERISHFRPFRDFMRITLLNFMLVFLGLAYYRPRNVFRKYRSKSLKEIFREDILKSGTPNHIIAFSVAFGIFMGILPIWGYQLYCGQHKPATYDPFHSLPELRYR
jgi:glycosyltransferase involved in cell wall biosynthesis